MNINEMQIEYDKEHFKRMQDDFESYCDHPYGRGLEETYSKLRKIVTPTIFEEARAWLKLRGHDVSRSDAKSTLIDATVDDYVAWLLGYSERGGKIHYYRDCNFMGFYKATWDYIIPKGTCGTRSYNIIAPVGIRVIHEGQDHCGVYHMDYSNLVPSMGVPMFNDVLERLKDFS